MSITNPYTYAVRALKNELVKLEKKMSARAKIESESLDFENVIEPLVKKIARLEVDVQFEVATSKKELADKKKQLTAHRRKYNQHQKARTVEWMEKGDELIKQRVNIQEAIRRVQDLERAFNLGELDRGFYLLGGKL